MGSTNITSGNAKKALLSALDVIGELPPHPARDITTECNDLLTSKNQRIDELEADLAAANAKIAELESECDALKQRDKWNGPDRLRTRTEVDGLFDDDSMTYSGD